MLMKRTELDSLGEFGLIRHLTDGYVPRRNTVMRGIGDDAAAWQPTPDMLTLVTTDMLVEGIHFDLAYTPLKHLGYKAVTVNVSDIYAMNGVPKYITVSMALSNRYSVEALEELYAGMYAACAHYGVDLVGGDTTSSLKGMCLSITAIGEVAADRVVYRNTAQVGDIVCVTGNLGAAYLGLQILEREKGIFMSNPEVQPDVTGFDYLLTRLLKPEARKDAVEFFSRANMRPTAMIDVSDGLASELLHICTQSGVGAMIEEAALPIHPDTYKLGIDLRLDATTCALSGGEDYELLFTVGAADLNKVKVMPDVYLIGEIVPAHEGVMMTSKSGKLHKIVAQGWQHFTG